MSKVPQFPPLLLNPTTNVIRAALTVRGPTQWQDMANATNWLLGKGSSLIVAGPDYHTIAPGTTRSYSFWIWPHEQNPNRVWYLSLLTFGNATGELQSPTSTVLGKWSAPYNGNVAQTVAPILQTVSSPSSSPQSINVVVKNDASSAGGVVVTGLCCYELPRRDLTIFTDSTVPEALSCNAKQPIYEGSTNQVSADGVARAAGNCDDEARRACLFSWCKPDGVPITVNSEPGSGNVFAIDIPIQPRSLYNGETERLVAWAALFKTSGGTAQLRARPSTGGTPDTFASPNTTETWHTGLVTAQTEDPSRWGTDGGMRGGAIGKQKITAWVSAAQTMTLYSLCIGEPPP